MSNKFWLNDPTALLKKDKMFDFLPKNSMSFSEKLNAISRTIIILTTLGYLFTKSFNILVSGIVTLIVIVILFKSKNNKLLLGKEGYDNIQAENFAKLAKTLTSPTDKNPYMNFMLTDYKDKPEKKPALPLFNPKVNLKSKMKNMENLGKKFPGPKGDTQSEVQKTALQFKYRMKSTEESDFNNKKNIYEFEKGKDNMDEKIRQKLFKNLGDSLDYDNFSRNFYTMPNTTNPNDQKAFAKFCYGDMKSCKEDACQGFMKSCKENNFLCMGKLAQQLSDA
tara:strand:- start:570 stop:1406 length:837 start_codon:yes stop_codon:yes gene_type:complete